MGALEEILSDSKRFINAEMILSHHHPVRIRQVEDQALYETARKWITELIDQEN